MDINLTGIDELKDAVDSLRMTATQLGLFAKTMTLAADKIDDALTAHIAAMGTFCDHQTFLETQKRERDLAQRGKGHPYHGV